MVETDISDTAAVKRPGQLAVEKWEHIKVWVNNAGVTVMGNLWDAPIKDQGRVINVNLKGTMYDTYAAIQQFREQGLGKLITLHRPKAGFPLLTSQPTQQQKRALKYGHFPAARAAGYEDDKHQGGDDRSLGA